MSDDVVIFHNPACGTSRNVLAALRQAGREPKVVEYLKAGWTKAQLKDLFARAGLSPRQALRTRGTRAEALGLTEGRTTDEAILDAMVAEPVLVERPFVITPKGAALCRPAETVQGLL